MGTVWVHQDESRGTETELRELRAWGGEEDSAKEAEKEHPGKGNWEKVASWKASERRVVGLKKWPPESNGAERSSKKRTEN